MRLFYFMVFFVASNLVFAEAGENPNNRKVKYSEIASLLDFATNNARSPFIKYVAKIEIKDVSKKFSDLRLWLTRKEKILQEIKISKQGLLDLPVYNKQQAKDTWLNINQPKDTVSISMSFEFSVGDKTEVPYYDLFILLDDINDFTSEMAGMASWLMSDMDAMKFIFEKPASIEFSTKKKRYQYKTNEDNEIVIDVKRKLYKENPLVKFSISPTGMVPED